jgi:cell division protein FtsW
MVFAPQGGHDYRSGRFAAVADPAKDKDGAGMQNWRSLVARANGGATGLGLGQSREKRRGGVPMQRTDFIFAVVGEEVGLVGTLSLLAMYLWLLVVGINLSVRSTDPFSRYAIAGITSSIVGQALLNMAVVTSIVPATGIPLPLVSYGGTSLVLTLAALGVVAALSRRKPVRALDLEN